MGQAHSGSGKDPAVFVDAIHNDYELVIRGSKELEGLLEEFFGGVGKGLHEKISSAQGIPEHLKKLMRYVATIRNKLVHDRHFNEIPDRQRFRESLKGAIRELAALVAARVPQTGKKRGGCVIC
uniref:DUF4145 domain-containing protein n=1 Tax=Chromera velia CCMP2878 TaxID=1169474 RepID=A0A0G4HYD2_9ALVE|eukprot:Cvel_9481.t1-p1 / transcript=Cvel_9481.t1 / gene=Cvel_9481 / organism=Chromera_velia_CCMP2878 / gene_product=hypothetical protein / transcript_product=hypothetical protein / location=Cvel_scaffold547:58541-58909(+) / protein_length=123 / sequence_SO=supercontig / SO=protein_coding / is_pseudo=false